MALRDVKTNYGWLRGIEVSEMVTAFYGVPFAMPPTGEKRWTYPVRPACWEGIRNANAFGNIAPQGIRVRPADAVDWRYTAPDKYLSFQESEDCLYLNLWTSAKTALDRLPVMVWIPGGGFVGGHPSEPQYSGEAMTQKGIILVTVQHRLGALGFLSHPLLEEKHGYTGNYALHDLIAALDWVQENISEFGGDPHNVTIGG